MDIFFFNDTATTEIYTLSLHDALPICPVSGSSSNSGKSTTQQNACAVSGRDRKSTRLNSSHSQISYAVFCLKKKFTRTRGAHPNCVQSLTMCRALARGWKFWPLSQRRK